MSRLTRLCLALGLIAVLTGCCAPPFARPYTSYNYGPAAPVAYGAPTMGTACNCGTVPF